VEWLRKYFLKSFLFFTAAFVCFFIGSSLGKFFFTLVSASSEKNELRIVSLHPVITENIFALGKGAAIVGATEYADYPEEAKKIPRVGDIRFNLEKIISLRPTIVIAMKQPDEELEHSLKRAGISYQSYRFEKLNDFEGLLKWLANLLSVQNKVSPLMKTWDEGWAKLSHIKPSGKKVFIEVQQQPLIAAGGDTFLSQLIEKCGLQNTFGHLKGYIPLSREAVLARSSDKVLVLLDTEKKEATKMWSEMSYRPQIVFFDPNTISRLTLRLPTEAKRLCRELNRHP